MASGRLAKAGRGELAVPLPAGYARRASGEASLDPDEQVQAVIRLVFRLFDELGTVHAVLRFLVEHQVQIGMRERSGPGKGEVAWRAPHQQGLSNMLRNPAYAGIYAYGRSRTDAARRQRGGEAARVRRLDDADWLVRIAGAWGRYCTHQDRIIVGHRIGPSYAIAFPKKSMIRPGTLSSVCCSTGRSQYSDDGRHSSR